MDKSFEELIKKINNIEINNKQQRNIIEKTIKILAKEFKMKGNIVVKSDDITKIFLKNQKKKKNTQYNNYCVLCQNNIKKKEHKSYLNKCDHCFHKKCLSKYLKVTKINFKCPICLHCYKSDFYKLIENSYLPISNIV